MVHLAERIPGFVQLDNTTAFYEPPSRRQKEHETTHPTLQSPQQDPDLIVFCSWMSAAPKHIAKYTAGYQSLFPNTAILLIEARLGSMFLANDFAAATSILTRYIDAKAPPAYRRGASIALHASSNGGANTAAMLALKVKGKGYAAPFDAITLDCAPGKANFTTTPRGIKLSLPDILFLRTLSMAFIYTFLAFYGLYNFLLRKPDVIAWTRGILNDQAVFGVNVPRLYMYSESDLLVEPEFVREHAQEARGLGCCGDEGLVREEVWERAGHCALVQEGKGRYWGLVEAVVRRAGKGFAKSGWV